MTESKESCSGIYAGIAPRRDGKYDGLYDFDQDFSNKAFALGVGAFFWHFDHSIVWIRLPCTPDTWSCWHIAPRSNHGGHNWTWDGNLERPTLAPSLWWEGHWHGYFRDGQIESV